MRRPALWPLVLLAALLWSGEYLRRDLWEPDEARFAYVAREMAQDGHWLVPHRSGEYYAHKPPLLFWLINLASLATGLPIGRLTVRLPGFFAGLLALWATARLAGRWAGERSAWPVVLTLCTTYLVWHEIGFARMDGLLLGWTMGAMALLFLNDDAPSIRRPALAWLLMGLGILTKGPVGLLVPAGAYAAARLVAGEGRCLRKAHWLWGPPLALVLPALWLGLAWAQGAPEGYFRELLFSQNLERAAGQFGGHRQPWHYFLVSAPADLLPWTLCLPAAVLIAFRDPSRRILLRRLAGWFGFIFVFFSLMISKRNIYILGAFPAVALATPIAAVHPAIPIPGWTLWPAGLAAAAGAVVLGREIRRPADPPRFLLKAALALLVLQGTVGVFVYPAFNPHKTPVALARAVRDRVPPDRPLLIYRINGEILAWYADRRGRVLHSPEHLREVVARERTGVIVFDQAQLDAWPRAVPLPPGELHTFRMGGKELAWLEFDLDAQ